MRPRFTTKQVQMVMVDCGAWVVDFDWHKRVSFACRCDGDGDVIINAIIDDQVCDSIRIVHTDHGELFYAAFSGGNWCLEGCTQHMTAVGYFARMVINLALKLNLTTMQEVAEKSGKRHFKEITELTELTGYIKPSSKLLESIEYCVPILN